MRVAKCDECTQIEDLVMDTNTGHHVMPEGWFSASWDIQPHNLHAVAKLIESRDYDLCPDCVEKIQKLLNKVIPAKESTKKGQSA